MKSEKLYILCIKQKKLSKNYQYHEFNKVMNRMDTIFVNLKISGISDPHRLLLNLSDRKNFCKMINMLPCQILACITHRKI